MYLILKYFYLNTILRRNIRIIRIYEKKDH